MDALLHLQESLLVPVDRPSVLFDKKRSFHTRWITAGHQIFNEKRIYILQIIQELCDTKVRVRDGKTSCIMNTIKPLILKIEPTRKDMYKTGFGQSSLFIDNLHFIVRLLLLLLLLLKKRITNG